MLDFLQRWLGLVIEPRRLLALRHLPRFIAEWMQFRRNAGAGAARLRDSFPCLSDRSENTPFDPHYFYQGAWLARQLAASRPDQHVDVGSSVLTMGVLSAHVPTVFVDYRPLHARQAGLRCVAGDINNLPFADGSLSSLSCLHVIEHIGLGRYGDPIDPDGARKAARELLRVLKPGGRLYLSTPVGEERVCFNAHRVFAPKTILAWFSSLTPAEFSYVDDDGRLTLQANAANLPALSYGCGLFVFQKP